MCYRITEIGSKSSPRNLNNKQLRRKDIKHRVLTELAPNGNLSCLLATADNDMALRTHFLYEIGGNIGTYYRCWLLGYFILVMLRPMLIFLCVSLIYRSKVFRTYSHRNRRIPIESKCRVDYKVRPSECCQV